MSDERRKQRSTDEPIPGEAHLSSFYEQTKEELPSASLDMAVLTAARRAVEPAPRASRVYFLPPRKWVIPLSLAAALLVVIGVTEFLPRPYYIGVDLAQREPERLRAQKNQSEIGREEGIVADAEKRKKSDAPRPVVVSPATARRDVQPSLTLATPSAPAEQEESDALVAAKALSPLTKERGISSSSQPQSAPAALEQKSEGRVTTLKDERLSLEEWIKRINELRRAKKLTEAEESLKKFKERYPAYPVEKFLE